MYYHGSVKLSVEQFVELLFDLHVQLLVELHVPTVGPCPTEPRWQGRKPKRVYEAQSQTYCLVQASKVVVCESNAPSALYPLFPCSCRCRASAGAGHKPSARVAVGLLSSPVGSVMQPGQLAVAERQAEGLFTGVLLPLHW